MREPPPPQLVALLERLGLATEAQVGRMAGRVRRLAGELPRFESVWVDALAQARVLTPFQAAEINAGRGERLRIGPFVLCERLAWPNYVACYRAVSRRAPGVSPGMVRLALCIPGLTPRARLSMPVAPSFGALAELADTIRSEHVSPIVEAARMATAFGRRLRGWKAGRRPSGWSTTGGSRPRWFWRSPGRWRPAWLPWSRPASATAI